MITKDIEAGSMTATGVQVSQLGEDLYRLEEEACLFFGAETEEEAELYPRYGDVIHATAVDETTIRYERVHERAPFKHFIFVVSEARSSSTAFQDFLHSVSEAGGRWEQRMGGMLMISMPNGSRFNPEHGLAAIDRGDQPSLPGDAP